MRTPMLTILLAGTLILWTVGDAVAQEIFETYEDGEIAFNWSGWPFGQPSGSVSVEGPIWNDDLSFPGGADQGCGGGISGVVADTTQALALGGIDNGDGTYDAVAVFVTFPEGPAVGTYSVDSANRTVGFIYLDNVSNLTIPEQDDDLLEWFDNLEATNRFGSTSGSVEVTSVSEGGFAGTFSGLMGDPETFDLRNVNDGVFAVVNVPVSAVPSGRGGAQLAAAPNPFNPQTTIQLTLDRGQSVTLGVYDMAGHRVARLHQGNLEAGDHSWSWSGRSDAGRHQAAGLYFCRATGRGWSRVTKLVLVP